MSDICERCRWIMPGNHAPNCPNRYKMGVSLPRSDFLPPADGGIAELIVEITGLSIRNRELEGKIDHVVELNAKLRKRNRELLSANRELLSRNVDLQSELVADGK